ncbi:MAG: type II 3-dehydroquinate dehydratase [Actinomycetota bacterium]
MKVFVLNGPSLNMLGERQPLIYGSTTLAEVEQMCRARASQHGMEVDFRQTNDEGRLVDWLQEARHGADGVVLNAAAFSHYSLAVRDAVQACGKPVIEVHISNIFAREEFRATSVISAVAVGVISGLGVQGYLAAIDALAGILGEKGAE